MSVALRLFNGCGVSTQHINGKRQPQTLGMEQPAEKAGPALRLERPGDVLDLRIPELAPQFETRVSGVGESNTRSTTRSVFCASNRVALRDGQYAGGLRP